MENKLPAVTAVQLLPFSWAEQYLWYTFLVELNNTCYFLSLTICWLPSIAFNYWQLQHNYAVCYPSDCKVLWLLTPSWQFTKPNNFCFSYLGIRRLKLPAAMFIKINQIQRAVGKMTCVLCLWCDVTKKLLIFHYPQLVVFVCVYSSVSASILSNTEPLSSPNKCSNLYYTFRILLYILKLESFNTIFKGDAAHINQS